MADREAIELLLAHLVGLPSLLAPARVLLSVLMRVKAFFLGFVVVAQVLGRRDRVLWADHCERRHR